EAFKRIAAGIGHAQNRGKVYDILAAFHCLENDAFIEHAAFEIRGAFDCDIVRVENAYFVPGFCERVSDGGADEAVAARHEDSCHTSGDYTLGVRESPERLPQKSGDALCSTPVERIPPLQKCLPFVRKLLSRG